nr:hypothetical protein [Tanacetum cinerariifolium]
MSTKIELTLEQSQQGVSYDVLKDSNYLIHSCRVVCFETFRYSVYTVKRIVPAKSNSYCQAFNVKSLYGEIVSPKKSQVKLEGIRRSGRLKFKGPVIKENSIDEAIDVEDLSNKEGSEYSGEIQADNTEAGLSTSERCGFERTFAAKEMYPGNTMFAELEKRFIESLKYQQEESAKIGHASHGLDSPRYQLGPHTQAIVFETVDKQYKESERKKLFDFSDILSFSLRLTQEEYDMGAKTCKEVAKTYEKGVEAFSSRKSESRFSIDREENKVKARQDPLDVVPLNFFNSTNEVMVRGRRAVTLIDRMKSPFYVRVVNVDKVENSEEKRLETSCLNGDDSVVLFKTKYGQQSSRGQIETLGPQEPVDDNVLIPVSNVQQKFLLCVNLKNPAVTLIDSKKEGNKVTRKKKKDDDIDDMRVASILEGNRLWDIFDATYGMLYGQRHWKMVMRYGC